MYAGELCATMGNYWYKSNWRNIPTSLWRGTEWSGGLVVLKRSFTVSLRSLDVLSGFCVGVVCWFGWFCFGFVFGHPVFCAFICSPTAWDQLTDHATCSIGVACTLCGSSFTFKFQGWMAMMPVAVGVWCFPQKISRSTCCPSFWGSRRNCGPPNGVPHGAKREFQANATKKQKTLTTKGIWWTWFPRDWQSPTLAVNIVPRQRV